MKKAVIPNVRSRTNPSKRMNLFALGVTNTDMTSVNVNHARGVNTVSNMTVTMKRTARTVCYAPLMAAAVLCILVKRYVNDEVIPARVILDLTTFTLITERR